MLADASWVDMEGEEVEKIQPKTNEELKNALSKLL